MKLSEISKRFLALLRNDMGCRVKTRRWKERRLQIQSKTEAITAAVLSTSFSPKFTPVISSVARNLILMFVFFCCITTWQGCTVSYSFSGASIPVEAKTFSVSYFRNNATLVEPTLSQTLTDALKNKMTNQTRLAQVDRNGDLAFEGSITNYAPSQPGAISGEAALLNRMTITISVKFSNSIDTHQNFEKSFSQYAEYDSSTDLMSIQSSLIDTIVELLVDDIFNQAVVNW